MGLLSSITVKKNRDDSDLTVAESHRAGVVREALDEMKAKAPMIGQLIGSLGDSQLLEIADFILGLAHKIESVESPMTVVPDPVEGPDAPSE